MSSSSPTGPLVVSLLLALMLSFVPLRGDETYWRPLLLLMVVLFWLISEPELLGIGFAWSCGLLLDLMSGGILGMHALALAICAYLLLLLGPRMQHFALWHHTILVALLAIVYQLVVIFIYLLAGRDAQRWTLFYPVVTTALIWPFLASLLGRIYRPNK